MIRRWLFLLVLLPSLAGAESIDLPCIADTSIVLYPGEEHECHGAKPEIRIKGNQHVLALDFEWRRVRGRRIIAANLVCRQGTADVAGVTISTITVPWQETTASGAVPGMPGATGWGASGRLFPAAADGNGGSRCATCTVSAVAGVYTWPVPPDLIEACVTGSAHGLAVHELSADYSRNPTILARESGHGPRLVVTVGEAVPFGPPAPQVVLIPPALPVRVLPAVAVMPPLAQPVLIDLCAVPITDGQVAGAITAERRRCNPLFDGRTVRLRAAAGEVACIQVLLRGAASTTAVLTMPGIAGRLTQAQEVALPDGRMVPEVLLPLLPTTPLSLQRDRDLVLVIELPVPFTSTATVMHGALMVADGRVLPIELTVLPLVLPRAASFSCEMNGYGMPDTVAEFMALQWAAYDRRCHVNLLHYSHHTAAADARRSNLDLLLPDGRRMDESRYNRIAPGAEHGFWDDFDAAFDGYLSGLAFASGHRGVIPAPGFYLTFHESWPLPLRPYWNGDLDAASAFTTHPEYAATFMAVLTDFLHHAQQRGWTRTGFQVFLNNKGDAADPTRGPWVLDEPSAWWDYRALDWYGRLVGRAQTAVPAVHLDYRVDISRPEFRRGQLATQVGLWVVADGAQIAYPEVVAQAVADSTQGRLWLYGGAAPVGSANLDNAAWILSAFARGADGVVPWLTVDPSGKALTKAVDTALFITDRRQGGVAIRPTLRLLSFLAAEQAVEYLNLLRARGWSRAELAHLIATVAPVDGAMTVSADGDAGTSGWRLHPDALFRLQAVAAALLVEP